MGFFSGATTMDALVDKIADDLIATGAWGTADASLGAGASPAKRALQHLTDTTFFVTLERVVTNTGSRYFNEVKIRMSTGFDAVTTHEPTGTIKTGGIPAEAWTTSSSGNYQWPGGGAVGNGNKTGVAYLWTDASGFTGMVSWTAHASTHDYAVLFSLERNTSKEYADGYTNFFFTSLTNSNPSVGSGYYYYGSTAIGATGGPLRPLYVRPFNLEDYGISLSAVPDPSQGFERFFKAYKSPGNSKVYLQFPWFSNNLELLQRNPIAQTKRWFYCQESTGGLADGDLINVVVGAETWTYLVKLMQSPDSAAFIPYAIRQA